MGGSDEIEARRRGHRHLVERTHSEIYSNGELALVEELYSSDFVGHLPSGVTRGRSAMRGRVEALRRAFPDWTEEIEEIAIDGDLVVARFISRGTNLGRFLGRPATGRRVEITEVAFYRVRAGQVIEQRVFPDMLRMQQQLGFIE